MTPDTAVAAVARRYELALGGRFRGSSGSRRGLQSGGAQEFLDFRAYAPGDDLRHLDWRGYARSDQLRVRLFEEEVAPLGEVLLDASASMASTPGKQRAHRQLAALFLRWIRAQGGRARCLQLGGGEIHDIDALSLEGAAGLLPVQAPLRRRGVRIVLSDFLVAEHPAPFLLRIAAGAARLIVVQLLDAWEREPQPGAATTLRDIESGRQLEVTLDLRTIAGYRARLLHLQSDLRVATIRAGGTFATVVADAPEAMCRRHLLPAGIVVPRP